MDFSLLNKIKEKKKDSKISESSPLDILIKKNIASNYSQRYLEAEPITLIGSLEKVDKLTTIQALENNMSLLVMLSNF